MRDSAEYEIDLIAFVQSFGKFLLKFWWIPVLLGVIGGLMGVWRTWKSYYPMYRSTASMTVMVETTNSKDPNGFYYDNNAAEQLATIFPYILTSSLLSDYIKADLNVDSLNGNIEVSMVDESNLLTMSVTSPDPSSAKEILESAIRVCPDVARFVIGNMELHMVSTPEVPQQPYNKPNYQRNIEVLFLAGFMVGLVALALLALLRQKIQRPEELEPVTSMPCLGKVSALGREKHRHISILEQEESSQLHDEISSMSLAVMRELNEINGKVLMVTSTLSSEGKSAISENLAYVLAAQEKRVLLVDGDLRKQNLFGKVGAEGTGGLECMIAQNKSTIEKCELPGIYFIGGNHPAESPSPILNSQRMGEIFAHLRAQFDFIIIDTPPIQMFEDAMVLSGYADGILYVVRHNWVQRHQILDMLTQLGEAHTKVLGFVYNGQPRRYTRYGYGYGYGYGYKYRYGKYGYGYGKRKSKHG